MKILVLHDKRVGQQILDIIQDTAKPGDEIVAKSILEFPDYYDEYGKIDAPPWLKQFQPDWLISAWWPKIIHTSILSCAKHTLNTHNSFLPWSRGKHPNFWSIVDHVPYGVSLHEITPEIDRGGIYAQEQVNSCLAWSPWGCTGQTLYDLGILMIVKLFANNWFYIRNGERKPNGNTSGGTFHEAKELEPARTIDLDTPTTARRLLNIIRAAECNGYSAHFRDGESEYSVTVKITDRITAITTPPNINIQK